MKHRYRPSSPAAFTNQIAFGASIVRCGDDSGLSFVVVASGDYDWKFVVNRRGQWFLTTSKERL